MNNNKSKNLQWRVLEWAEGHWNKDVALSAEERGWSWIGDGLSQILDDNPHRFLNQMVQVLGLIEWRRCSDFTIEYRITATGLDFMAEARKSPAMTLEDQIVYALEELSIYDLGSMYQRGFDDAIRSAIKTVHDVMAKVKPR